ncbi:nucleotide exchange factor Fes1-domain-containing protein [Mycena albidolilacea]|uniref:Nucleotide exchange factor Fes1-domain-containing protein n=1 Tax=Mycena albidolilacea TaxID=1033008 RepID=A0AAD7A9V0_9AGAR|nr:nucleotide exchange factor Fes1-domain-containing protein [Mycena albidolilacea]
MESLLRWGIENSTPSTDANNTNPPPAPRQDLDPGIIDMILGKSDAELMKEDMAVAVDEAQSEDARVNALDHLEMLIEQIDNANNLEKLHLWAPLQTLLSTAPTPSIKMHVLWVIGTALQNNPAAQDAYATHDPLPLLTAFLSPSPSSTAQIRAKAIYALSGLLKHNAPAVEALSRPEVQGWERLRAAVGGACCSLSSFSISLLSDPDLIVRRKALFLLSTLIIPSSSSSSSTSSSSTSPSDPIHPNSHAAALASPSRTATSPLALPALSAHGLLDTVVAALVQPVPWGPDGDQRGDAGDARDADFEETGVRLLHTYAVACGGAFDAKQKARLGGWLGAELGGEGGERERWGLSRGEAEELAGRVEV